MASDALPWDSDDAPAGAPASAPRTPPPARTLRDMEAMIGVDPIDVLQADRRAHVEDLAPLRAKYAAFGTWDAQRKAHRSAVANLIAGDITRERGKAPSEAETERLAAGDDRVIAFLAHAEEEMARYHLLEHEVASLTELIRRGDALIRFSTYEPKV